jgi:hypothetical protein
MMTELKALTVCQGWASAMFLSTPKDVENRTWATNYRGDLLIHAGKSKKYLKECTDFCRWHHLEMPEDLPMGAIIGAVVLTDCTRRSPSIWAQPEQFHWVLQAPQLFEIPVPCNGQLGLWVPTAKTVDMDALWTEIGKLSQVGG